MNYSVYPLILLSTSALLGIISCHEPSEENDNLDRFLERRLHEAKMELDRIVMDANGLLVRNKRDPKRPMITFDKRIENNLETDGEIYYFHKILVLNSEIINRIDKKIFEHFIVLCGNCIRLDFKHVIFIEVVERHSHMFIVIGMDDGYLNLFSTQLSAVNSHHQHQNKYILLQKIPSARGHHPVDGKFFMDSGHLFLYVIYQSGNGDPSESILFRFRKSYLDKEYNNIITDGSKSVETFSSGTSQIIVIAQAANTSRKISSQVLRFSHSKKKLERIQLLETKRPTSLTHFGAFENDFVFVCEESSPSTIYWWKGGELKRWLDLPFMSGNCSFSAEQVHDETLLLNILNNEATMYALGWKYIKEAVPIAQPVNDDQKIINLFISTGNISHLTIVGTLPKSIRLSIWDLTLLASTFTGEGEKKATIEDHLTECLSKAEGNLGAIAKQINDTNELANNHLIQLNRKLSFDTIHVLGHDSSVKMNSGSAGRVNHVDEKSETETEIDALVMTSSKLTESVIDRLHVTFKSNLAIKDAKLKLASAARVNNRHLSPTQFIWLNEQQQLTNLTANQIKVDRLQTENIAWNRIDDFVLKQTFNSGQTLFLKNLTCNEMYSKLKKINDIHLDLLLKENHNDLIRGNKYFKTVAANRIIQNTGTISQGKANEFSNNIQSNSLILKDNTIIDNLNVQKINEIDVHRLFDNIALKNVENSISNGLTFMNDIRVDLLRGQRISQSQPKNSGRRSTTSSLREIGSGNEKMKSDGDDCIIEEVDNYNNSEETVQKSRSIFQSRYPNYHLGRDIHVRGYVKANEIICENCKVVVQNQSFPISNLEEIFWTYDTRQNITVPIIINNSLSTAKKSIEATYINGRNLDCLLNDNNDRDFKPMLIFKNATVLGDILESSDLSHVGLKAKELNNSIVRSSATQYIEDRKNFLGGVSVNYLKAENLEQGSSSGLSTRFMRKSKGADEYRPQKFVVNGDLIVKEDLDVIYLNGIDIQSRIKLAALKDENCDFQTVEFKNLKMNNMDIHLLNGRNFETLIDSSKPSSKIHRAYISGNIEPLYLLNVTYINGINIHDHLPKVVNATEKAIIRGKKIFKSNLTIRNDLITERINDADLTDIYRSVLSKNRNQNIRIPVTITHDASMKSLNLEKLNGIAASHLINVSSNESITFNSNLVFRKLTVLGNVTIADSCNISQIDRELTLQGKRHWQNIHVIGNVSWREADSTKANIWNMFNKAVTTDKTHRVSGSVVLQKDLTVQQVQHSNDKNISKMNLTYIMQDSLMKISDYQVMMGEKIFLNHVSCNSMMLTADLLAKYINQENILEFNKTLVRKHSEDIIVGHKYFENGLNAFSLKTRGGVNRVPLDDIVITNSNRSLPEVIFENLEIIENFDIDNYNSINFDEFLKERFLISRGSHQVFNGSICFENDVIIKGESFVSTLNNVTVDSIVLTRRNSPTSAKVICGCKTFKSLLKVNGKISTKQVNNEVLHRIYKCSAHSAESTIIKGSIVFENAVTLDSQLWAQSYCIEGISINLTNAIKEFHESTGSKLLDEL